MDVVKNEKGLWDIVDLQTGDTLNRDFVTEREAWEYMDEHYPGY